MDGQPLEDLAAVRARLPRRLGGRLCLDFVNTVDPRHGDHAREYLRGYDDLVAWARVTGTLDDREAGRLLQRATSLPAEAAAVLDRAVALREALYRVFAHPPPPDPGGLEVVNREVGRALGQTCLRPATGAARYRLGWAEAGPTLDRPLWPVARSAAELLASPDADRVRECQGDGCGWLFLDTSRNRRRAWCSMDGCGNRAKARRHYARRRTGEAAP